MCATINLDAATAEQLAALITFKTTGKNILVVIVTNDQLHIVYITSSGYISVMKFDGLGKWICTEFYSSFEPRTNTYSGYVTERKNPNYDNKSTRVE